MTRQNYEQLSYMSCVDDTEVVVNYNKDNTMNIAVVYLFSKENRYYETYYIRLSKKTRKLPEFKRFSNNIRARIGTGIYLCSHLPGFDLHLNLSQLDYLYPWWLQRG